MNLSHGVRSHTDLFSGPGVCRVQIRFSSLQRLRTLLTLAVTRHDCTRYMVTIYRVGEMNCRAILLCWNLNNVVPKESGLERPMRIATMYKVNNFRPPLVRVVYHKLLITRNEDCNDVMCADSTYIACYSDLCMLSNLESTQMKRPRSDLG